MWIILKHHHDLFQSSAGTPRAVPAGGFSNASQPGAFFDGKVGDQPVFQYRTGNLDFHQRGIAEFV